ncbi:Reverse transcriptase zinc-binding domain protein [Raphanus sativus]|nr:Reverse transcriptase zinc-binding domain protein [Raphanus sativus]
MKRIVLSGRVLLAFINQYSVQKTLGICFISKLKLLTGTRLMVQTSHSKTSFLYLVSFAKLSNNGDRMLLWSSNVNPSCVFCNLLETRDHLFFSCPFTSEVWSQLTKDLFRGRFTTDWTEITEIIKDNRQELLTKFLIRYVLQLSIHSLWRERNDRRHRATPTTVSVMVGMLDRQVRNKCLSFRPVLNFTFAAALGVRLSTR